MNAKESIDIWLTDLRKKKVGETMAERKYRIAKQIEDVGRLIKGELIDIEHEVIESKLL